MQNHIFHKEITFEGYFGSCWETSYLSKTYEFSKRCEKWFKNVLKSLIEMESSESHLFFDDLIPKEIYKRILEEPKTKFHFKITVEVKEIGNTIEAKKNSLT